MFYQSGENDKVNFDDVSSHSSPEYFTGNEIVISGISGIFPESENVQKFMENLYNKVDMVVPVDFFQDLLEMPRHQGKVSGLEKFDAQFFRVTFNQSSAMDPMARKLMELAYSAIFDAGINPLDFNGQKLGVFVGTNHLDTLDVFLYEGENRSSFYVSGSSKTMMPNRISYWIDSKAASYSADMACAGSLACLEHAYHSIITGQCDAAIVGGSNVCLLAEPFVNMKRAGLLCMDGKTKCFDKNGDGYVRSEAINVILLQKAKDAKRIYSQVYYSKVQQGLKQGEEISPKRRIDHMKNFFEECYSDINVSPQDVEYIEANASGIAEADANEMEAIGSVFGEKLPVKIGSVRSNMGNSESASGLCAVIKLCLAYQSGKIPGNINYTEPHDIPSIREKKVEVVTDTTSFKRGLVAINGFSYTGVDVHVVLKGHYKPKDKKKYSTNIPYLVTVSGRQEECVDKILKHLETQAVDPELIGLLHNIFQTNTPNHTSRGFTILDVNDKGETVCLAKSSSYYPGETRPVCFMYSGMGSQWPGMGTDLMRIPTFRKAIMRCHEALAPKGIDIVKIITDNDKHIFDNILHCFVGISAIQIGLTDVLTELGIVPDIIIGHSLGETQCAYADGCFTTEETILTSYSRGFACTETDFIHGAMAAVGMGFSGIIKLVPPEIDIACHNSNESSTISGPAEAVTKFVKELHGRGIFAKEVPSCGISFHSRYTAVAGPKLMSCLKDIINSPQQRSDKWLCTSIPKERWNDPIAKYSSPDYHVNNLLSPVYFEETSKMLPVNAVIIEIAPHGLLQAIMKRSHSECDNIPLTKRGTDDSVTFLLQAIGKIYETGVNPKVAELYPKIEYPVSTETPLLSHFVEWEHSENW
ncbi:fatty acid synthase-like [Epargyreus clarus]|uniref:fatty acid synthase-like n=1 Tax=Epargyreus clarus TaxID=520877 RepID=UPI003C2C720D